jgi:hypothetical protein
VITDEADQTTPAHGFSRIVTDKGGSSKADIKACFLPAAFIRVFSVSIRVGVFVVWEIAAAG